MKTKPICSICRKPYTGFGNNAYPFPGICCDSCNAEYVIPHRMTLLYWQPKPKEEQQ